MRSMLNFTVRYVPLDPGGPWSDAGAAGKYYGMAIGFLHLRDDVDILIGKGRSTFCFCLQVVSKSLPKKLCKNVFSQMPTLFLWSGSAL